MPYKKDPVVKSKRVYASAVAVIIAINTVAGLDLDAAGIAEAITVIGAGAVVVLNALSKWREKGKAQDDEGTGV